MKYSSFIVTFIVAVVFSVSAHALSFNSDAFTHGVKIDMSQAVKFDKFQIYSQFDAIHKKAKFYYETTSETVNLAIGTSEMVRADVTTVVTEEDWRNIWHGCLFESNAAKRAEICGAMKTVVDGVYGTDPIDNLQFIVMEELIYKVMYYKEAYEWVLTKEALEYFADKENLEIPFVGGAPTGMPFPPGGTVGGGNSGKVCSASGGSKDFGLAGDPQFFGDAFGPDLGAPGQIPMEMLVDSGQFVGPEVFDCEINASIIINNGDGGMTENPTQGETTPPATPVENTVNRLRELAKNKTGIDVKGKKINIPLNDKTTLQLGEMKPPKPPESSSQEKMDNVYGGLPKAFMGIGVNVTFTPRPDEGGSLGQGNGFCGGPMGGSLFGGCFDDDDSDGCEDEFSEKYGPVAMPADPMTNGGICANGTGPIDGKMTDEYYTDENPNGDGPPDPDGGSGCDPSVGGKPSSECCQQNPAFPGCGSGPIYFQNLFSNPKPI